MLRQFRRRSRMSSTKTNRWERALAHRFRLEYLEDRHLLTAAQATIQDILWNGAQAETYAGQWVLRIDPSANPSIRNADSLESALKLQAPDLRADVIRSLGADGVYEVHTSLLDYQSVAQELSALAGFQYVEPNFVIQVSTTFPNDSSFGELWGLHNTGQNGGLPDADIDAPEAWDISTGSTQVVVGVIDTGVDYTHPDLAANIWTNPGEIAGDGIDNDGNGFVDDIHGWDFAYDDSDPMDVDGHGTHVSGTIGGVGNNGVGVAGVNWNVKIMALKFLNDSGSGSTADAVDALNYAAMMKRDYGVNIRLTNNSWGGGGFSTALRDAIAANAAQDILFVAAAGNQNTNTDFGAFYPANYDVPNIISVAATDRFDERASFSNYGATTVDLAAPGVSIYSTVPGGYAYYSGTSMASPHVAGVAALAFSLNPTASYTQVKQAILSSVDPIPSMQGITVTGGRLNAYKTLVAMGLQVVETIPGPNTSVSSPPTQFTIRFSDSIVSSSVNPTDLLVNGVPASSVAVNGNQAVFQFNTSPVTSEGPQFIQVVGGSILRQSDGDANDPFEEVFYYDITPLEVASVEPVAGPAELPVTSFTMTLNEAVRASSVDPSDLVLSRGSVVSATVLNPTTISFAVSNLTTEGALTISIAAGRMLDTFGSPNRPFSATYELDFGTVPFPIPLNNVGPLGSLIHEGTATGIIGSTGDVDQFTLALLTGQTIAAVLDGDTGLTGRVQLRSPSGTPIAISTSPSSGGNAYFQAIATETGTYTIEVSGVAGSTGRYSLRAVLNSQIEQESITSGDNNSRGNSQNLDSSFIPLPGGMQRGAVVGRGELPLGVVSTEVEPNDTLLSANDATRNFLRTNSNSYQLSLRGEISSPFEFDWYRIGTLDTGDVISITQNGAGAGRGTNPDTYVYLYRGTPSNPILVASNDDSGPSLDSLIFRQQITSTDTYYIAAASFGSNTGTYDLTAWLDNVGAVPLTGGSVFNEVEPNNSALFATDASTSWKNVSYVSTTQGSFAFNDVDFFRFSFREGDIVTASVQGTAFTSTPQISILNSLGASLASDQFSTGDTFNATVQGYRIPSTGTYYVRVNQFGGPSLYTLNVSLSPAGEPPESVGVDDFYSVTLAAGQLVSIVGSSVGSSGEVRLELQDATGIPRATSVPSANLQAALTFTPTVAGTYFIRASATPNTDYSLVVTRNGLFDTEPNNSTSNGLANLDGVAGALGYLDANRPDVTGQVNLAIDPTQSFITISGTGTAGALVLPILEQSPGSLTSNYQGIIGVVIDGSTIRFNQTSSADPIGQVGNFLPGNAPADYAGRIDLAPPVLVVNGAFRNLIFNANSTSLPLNEQGGFTASAINFIASTGRFDYALSTITTGSFNFAGESAPNQTSALGEWEILDGTIRLFIPVFANLTLSFNGINIYGELNGQIVATANRPAPIDPKDMYEVFLRAGETLTASTTTPFGNDPTTGPNLLDPRLVLLNSSGGVVASDENGAGDGRNARIAFTAPTTGLYRISVEAAAGRGEYVLSKTVAANRPPVLAPIPTKNVVEGSTLSFFVSASDPDVGQTLTYSLADGAPAGASIDPLTGLFQWTPTDDQTVSVSVIVQDNGSPVLGDVKTFQIVVLPSAPIVTLGGVSAAVPGQTVSLTLFANDASPVDQAAGFTFSIDWDNNGTIDQIVVGPSGTVVERTFDSIGSRTVAVSATDVDGVQGPVATRTINVTPSLLVSNGPKQDLYLGFSQGNDGLALIELGPGTVLMLTWMNNGLVKVKLDLFTGVTGNVIVYTLGGDDFINAIGMQTISTIQHAGAGNDWLIGGAAGDLLDGGADNDLLDGNGGNDTLLGGSGADILIGGTGADVLLGGAGSDLLVTGVLSHPQRGVLFNALRAEWDSSRTYSEKVANLSGVGSGPRANGNVFLTPGTTLFDDQSVDVVMGESDNDWFVGRPGQDFILDRNVDESLLDNGLSVVL